MGRKKNSTSEMEAAEKLSAPLTQRLNELITDSSELKDFLGCSIQAINQYKLGISRPSLENLCKIADFYGVSTDYLLGLSNIATNRADIQAVCAYTGLSEKAVLSLASFAKEDRPSFFPSEGAHKLEVLNAILTTDDGELLLIAMYRYLLGDYDAITMDQKNDGGDRVCISEVTAGLRDAKTGKIVDILQVRDIPAMYLFRIQEHLHGLREKIQGPPAITVEL